MNLFTVNQVNQVYVVKANSTFKIGDQAYNPVKGSGDVYGGIAPSTNANEKSLYFKYAGPAGVTRSDIIDINKIISVKITAASHMAKPLMQYVLTDGSNTSASYVWPALDSTGTYMKAGYDFILRITLNNYVGISPEDAQYWKYAMVHTGPNMTPNAFWKEMAKSLLRNMSREATKFITVHGTTNGTTAGAELTLDNFDATWSNSNKGIIIREAEPDWVLGLKQQKVVGIEVTPVAFEADRATDDGTIVYWGYSNDNNIQTYDHKLEAVDSGVTIPNGKLTADYEYFFHGERGDQYRMMGWPDYIPTEYMVDPTKEYGYIQIHYSYIGSNESCQKSEKDITFVIDTSATSFQTALREFLSDELPNGVVIETVGE